MLLTGERVEMTRLNAELEERFAVEIDGEDSEEDEPPPLGVSVNSLSTAGDTSGGAGGEAVVAAIGEMQVAQRQTDAQINLISQQVKELTATNSSTMSQLQELTSAIRSMQQQQEE
jgi:hypothetical protein